MDNFFLEFFVLVYLSVDLVENLHLLSFCILYLENMVLPTYSARGDNCYNEGILSGRLA